MPLNEKQVQLLKAMQTAVDDALEKLDKENEKWVKELAFGVKQRKAILAGVKRFEAAMEDYFSAQRKAYAALLQSASIEKADKDETLDSVVQTLVDMLFEDEDGDIQRLADLYHAFADPFLSELAQLACDELVKDKVIETLTDRATEWLKDHAINFAQKVQETTHEAVIEALRDSIQNGGGIADAVQQLFDMPEFDWRRARTTARTESIAAANAGTLEGWRQSEVVTGKSWYCSMRNSRDTHIEAEDKNKNVPLDEPFEVGSFKMMHPGDSSLGAPAEEVCNCKCTMLSVTAARSERG